MIGLALWGCPSRYLFYHQGWAPGSPVQPENLMPVLVFSGCPVLVEPENRVRIPDRKIDNRKKPGAFQLERPAKFPVELGQAGTRKKRNFLTGTAQKITG